MGGSASEKRERLTGAAALLAHTRGFERTTIGDIAEAADVPAGSVYYYFKTKDEVGRAVAESLHGRYALLLAEWEAEDDPRARLRAYVDMHVRDAETLSTYGCPIGSLCTELRKHSGELSDEAAGIFRLTLAWAAAQFSALGLDAATAEDSAHRLLAGVQGAAVLANALGSTDPIMREADRLKAWIASTPPPISKGL